MTLSDKKIRKNPVNYFCEHCDYNTSDKKDFNKHNSTQKHIKRINDDKLMTNNDKKSEEIRKYVCSCGKHYKYRQGLFNHQKKYHSNISNDIIEIKDDNNEHKIDYEKIISELINTVQEQNKLIKDQHNTMKDLIPKVGNNNVNNNGNINIVKIDNITLLNDKCKDALSMNDFINSIDINVKDLLYTSKKGLPSGISHILVEHLNNLPLVKRPIWCSDKKRKRLFIKEEEWYEDMNQEKTKEAIKNLSVKQTKNINKYTKENPDWMENDKKKDVYISIVKNVTDQITDKSDKIIDSLIDTIHLSQEKNKLLTESI